MTSGADIRGGISVDQVAAKEFGKHTPARLPRKSVWKSSENRRRLRVPLMVAPITIRFSWRNETTPPPDGETAHAPSSSACSATAARIPKARLAIRQEDKSILDAINSDVKRLRVKVGGNGPLQGRSIFGCHPRC